jgi:hypothetical protein
MFYKMTNLCSAEQLEKEIDSIIDNTIRDNLNKSIDKSGLRPLVDNIQKLLQSYIDIPNHIDTYLNFYTGQWGNLITNPLSSTKAFLAFAKMQNAGVNINKQLYDGSIHTTMQNIGKQVLKSAINLKDNFNLSPILKFLEENKNNSKNMFENLPENEKKLKNLANEMGFDENLIEMLKTVYKIKKQLNQEDFKIEISKTLSDKLKKVCKQFENPDDHLNKFSLMTPREKVKEILERKNIYYKYIKHIFEIILIKK